MEDEDKGASGEQKPEGSMDEPSTDQEQSVEQHGGHNPVTGETTQEEAPSGEQQQEAADEADKMEDTQGDKPETQDDKPEDKPETKDDKPETQDDKPETQDDKPETQDDKPETQDDKPETQDDKPETQDDKPAEEPSGNQEFGQQADEVAAEQKEATDTTGGEKPEQEGEQAPESEQAADGDQPEKVDQGVAAGEQPEKVDQGVAAGDQPEKVDQGVAAGGEDEEKDKDSGQEGQAVEAGDDAAEKQVFGSDEAGESQKVTDESDTQGQTEGETTGDEQPSQSEGEAVQKADGEQEAKPAEDGEKKASDAELPAADAAKQGDLQEDGAPGPKSPVDGMAADTRGDEDDLESMEIIDDDAPKIPDDFFYNYEDHISRAIVAEDSGLPVDMLKLHHSFGYDCMKRANLHMLNDTACMFTAGNVVQLLDLKTKEQKYIRSTSGGGIGALSVHPSRKYFAVAEKGEAPNVNIYEYPSLKLYRILRGGTERSYSYVDFSPDGKLLASVGGDPDFMLTVWDWKQEKTMLRSKAFSQEVFRVTFSSELEGQLTSSGTGHIRFWKMARTFTGLKLQGAIGKFGKTEISDIEGYVELPDGKVLSGSEWGNLLLWDGGLIKVEISRKQRRACHQGIIQQIIMDEGELMTLGTDGYIRVWDFETIDTAEITDESSIFEMEPMNELKVGDNVRLRSIVKSADPEEPTMWYCQDMNGGIWKLDLSFSFTSQAPEKLCSYHAGEIGSVAASPIGHLVATIGQDKSVRVYDYLGQQQLCEAKFSFAGCSLLWAPKKVDPKGSTLIAGFEDGVVRVLTFQKSEATDVHGRKLVNQSELALRQAFKPHNEAVVAMALDSKGEILATGSTDDTIFFMKVGTTFKALGFIKTPSAVSHLDWAPSSFEKNTLLVCCVKGEVMEVEAPDVDIDTAKTYLLEDLKIRYHQFKSVKSRLRHDEEMARKAKELAEKKKLDEAERRKRIERGIETESDNGEEEEEEEEEEEDWKPYIPSEPSPILHGFHAKEPGKFWLSMDGYDAGYMYECEFLNDDEKSKTPADDMYEPSRCIPIHESRDVPICDINFSNSGKQLIMGMQNGAVRIQPLQSDDPGLMGPFWNLTVHDNQYGQVTHVCMSFDDKYLFTVGKDGNFFVYEFMEQEKIDQRVADAKAIIPSARKDLGDKRIDDIEDPKAYSIEDAKQKAEYDKMMKLAKKKKVPTATLR